MRAASCSNGRESGRSSLSRRIFSVRRERAYSSLQRRPHRVRRGDMQRHRDATRAPDAQQHGKIARPVADNEMHRFGRRKPDSHERVCDRAATPSKAAESRLRCCLQRLPAVSAASRRTPEPS